MGSCVDLAAELTACPGCRCRPCHSNRPAKTPIDLNLDNPQLEMNALGRVPTVPVRANPAVRNPLAQAAPEARNGVQRSNPAPDIVLELDTKPEPGSAESPDNLPRPRSVDIVC